MTYLGSNDEFSNHRIYKKNIDFHLSMNFENDVYFGEDNLSLLNSSFANDTCPPRQRRGAHRRDHSEKGTAMSDYAHAINEHYGQVELGAKILTALRAAGKDLDALTREDLTSFDEQHDGGREGTRELARLAGLRAGMHVLDIGSGLGGPARTLAGLDHRVGHSRDGHSNHALSISHPITRKNPTSVGPSVFKI
jgi:hypothetical protein